MRISDWSSDVCSSDLRIPEGSGIRIGRGMGEGLGAMNKIAWDSLHMAAAVGVDLMGRGNREEFDRVHPFLELFVQGTYPVGLLDEKTGLLLVR